LRLVRPLGFKPFAVTACSDSEAFFNGPSRVKNAELFTGTYI